MRCFRKVRDEVVETVIMEFEHIFFGHNWCSQISLRSYLDEIIHVHADTSCGWQSSCRIIRLVDKSHLFELFHIVADRRWRNFHTFIADKGFTASRVTATDILPDDESEDLDFSCIDGGFSRHDCKLRIKKEKLKMEDLFFKTRFSTHFYLSDNPDYFITFIFQVS